MEKLVPNLKDKKMYVVYMKSLNQALKHDSKLKNVHRVIIIFEQSYWINPYLMLNKSTKIAVKNESEKDFLKTYEQ